MENKERVEVLKGASSLYYGFVPPSGIVYLVTKRAGKDPITNVSLMANMYGGANTHIDLGRRFGSEQQFGARINLLAGREDIGIHNFSGHRALMSGAFDWRITDKLSVKFDVEHYRKEVFEQAAIQALPAVNGVITLPPIPNARRNLAGEWQKYDAEATNLLLRADYIGLAAGLFLVLSGLTGSMIVFREEIEALLHSELMETAVAGSSTNYAECGQGSIS
jgi:iron complex outermembrane receptor protein